MPRLIAIALCLLLSTTASLHAGVQSCTARTGDGIAVFERASPSVVTIEGTNGRGAPAFGTGLVWSGDGLIVTNRHVVRQMSGITVSFQDGRRMPASALAVAPDADIALVRAGGPGPFTPVAVARGARLRVGEPVMAIGNPYGIGLSLSRGIISGLNRTVNLGSDGSLQNAIQTDASLNPGNSGGALLDQRGCLIGMNSAILSPTGTSAGIGFALPADAVAETVDRLLSGQFVAQGQGSADQNRGGAMHHPASPGPAALGVVVSFTSRGVLVEEVSGGSFADRVGSKVGDIITHVNGMAMNNPTDVARLTQTQSVRSITVLRRGQAVQLRVG